MYLRHSSKQQKKKGHCSPFYEATIILTQTRDKDIKIKQQANSSHEHRCKKIPKEKQYKKSSDL